MLANVTVSLIQCFVLNEQFTFKNLKSRGFYKATLDDVMSKRLNSKD